MYFNDVLKKYREFSFSERDKSDHFERLMQAYLQTDPNDWAKEVNNPAVYWTYY